MSTTTGLAPDGADDAAAFLCGMELLARLHEEFGIGATAVEVALSDWKDVTPCLAVEAGRVAVRTVGRWRRIEAGAPGSGVTGALLVDDAGNVVVAPSDQGWLTAVTSDMALKNIRAVDDVMVDGAWIRVVHMADHRCMVGVRPDARSEWKSVTSTDGPELLAAFILARQVARPAADGPAWSFDFPRSEMTVVNGTVAGLPEDFEDLASAAAACPSGATLERLHLMGRLDGPPARP